MAPTTGPDEGWGRPTGQPLPPPPGSIPGPAYGASAVGWAPPPPQQPPPPGSIPTGSRAGTSRTPRPPREADPRPAVLLAVALVAGATLDIGLRGSVTNLPLTIGLAAVIVGLMANGRVRQRSAQGLAVAALVPIAFLALRSSDWLAATNLAAIGGLTTAAIAYSRSGRLTDTTVGRLLLRSLDAIPAALSAPRTLAPLVPHLSSDRSARIARIARALAVCVPVLLVVTLLLATADPVFAGMLTPDLDIGPTVGHLVVALLLALGVVCVIGAAASDTEDRPSAGRFGALEVVTMLSVTAVVLGLFVVSQVVAATSAGERLVARSGMTPAEYARSGFFQLCWATGLIVSLLAAIRALAVPDVLQTRAVRGLGAVVPVLALGLVAVSMRRMALYDDAFGLTMLRLWVLGAAAWMGIVLVLVALRNAGVGARREWVLAAAATAAFVLVVAADVANPEAFVARHNLDRASRGAELDPGYLSELSDDAVPTMAAAWDRADAGGRAELRPALRCSADRSGASSLNLAVQRAQAARANRCDRQAGD